MAQRKAMGRPLQRPDMGRKRRHVVYVPDALWRRLTDRADAEGVSASEALTRLLEALPDA
jgi:hypothetical protein